MLFAGGLIVILTFVLIVTLYPFWYVVVGSLSSMAHLIKNGYVLWPIRIAVSGRQMTPCGATELMEVIGKEETLKRVRAAIAKLEA